MTALRGSLFAARHVRRPVRWLEDQREHLTAMNHATAAGSRSTPVASQCRPSPT